MKIQKRITSILAILWDRYPNVAVQLNHNTAFELLAATILSAQCTDARVNQVTPDLFARYRSIDAFAGAPLAELESLIRSTGFFHTKAAYLKQSAQMILDSFNGAVPDTMTGLTRLPGVGRKTANVVLSAWFGRPAIVVDTHVRRISRRLGLTVNHDPDKIEGDLMAVIPEDQWDAFCLRLIHFGRAVCRARVPRCPDCPIAGHCPSAS